MKKKQNLQQGKLKLNKERIIILSNEKMATIVTGINAARPISRDGVCTYTPTRY